MHGIIDSQNNFLIDFLRRAPDTPLPGGPARRTKGDSGLFRVFPTGKKTV